MVSIIEAVMLGVVQGITEWLPVSSSGHLVIFQQIFKIQVPLLFDILLHVGTALVVIYFMRREVLQIIKALLKLDFKSKYGRWLILLFLGSIPTALIGYFGYSFFSSLFQSLSAVGLALLVTGSFLFFVERWEKQKKLHGKHAVIMGIAQGLAIIPGISRSGATIGSALLAGVEREQAARFSFLLAVPAILGAAIFEAGNISLSTLNLTIPILMGTLVAMIVGYFSLKFLLQLILQRKLWVFGLYCWFVGMLVLLL